MASPKSRSDPSDAALLLQAIKAVEAAEDALEVDRALAKQRREALKKAKAKLRALREEMESPGMFPDKEED